VSCQGIKKAERGFRLFYIVSLIRALGNDELFPVRKAEPELVNMVFATKKQIRQSFVNASSSLIGLSCGKTGHAVHPFFSYEPSEFLCI